MAADAVYVYCFARAGAKTLLAAPGIGGRPANRLERGPAAAIYSRVDADHFKADAPNNRINDPQWVISCARRHECVVEEALRAGPVVPLRFGTVFTSPDALGLLLEERGPRIAAMVDSLAGNEEWAVKAYIDVPAAREWLIASDPVLAEARRLLPAAEGTRYFQQKRLDADADRALACWRGAVAEEIMEKLQPWAVDTAMLPAQDRRIAGQEGEMVLNLAVLVRQDQVDLMRDAVTDAAAAYSERGLRIEVTGPWPPYSFCPPLDDGTATE